MSISHVINVIIVLTPVYLDVAMLVYEQVLRLQVSVDEV